jgi:protein-disulfide isomerase
LHRLSTVAVIAVVLAAPALAQQLSSNPETSPGDVRVEIEALRKEIGDLRRELHELKQRTNPRAGTTAYATGPAVVSATGAPAIGRADAPVTIVEFSDYQCPFCRRHVATTLPALKDEYIDAGKVRYVFRDMPIAAIHRDARKAAEAARCAGDQGRYWEMHDRLFASPGQLSVPELKGHAKQLALKVVEFDQCLDGGRHTDAVLADEGAARMVGATATPTFFIGRTRPDGTIEGARIVGAQPLSAFRKAIDELLASM